MPILLDQASATPITHVSGASSLAFPFVNQPTAGATVFCYVWGDMSSAACTVTDNASGSSNTYTQEQIKQGGTTATAYLFKADNIRLPASGNLSVTASFAATHIIEGGVVSFTGVKSGAAEATNTGATAGTWSGAISTPSVGTAAGLWIATMGSAGGVTATITTTAPGTQEFVEGSGTFEYGAGSYQIGGTPPQAITWNSNGSTNTNNAGYVIGAYLAAPAGGVATPPSRPRNWFLRNPRLRWRFAPRSSDFDAAPSGPNVYLVSPSESLGPAADALLRDIGFFSRDTLTAATELLARVAIFNRSDSDVLTPAVDSAPLRVGVFRRGGVADVLSAASDVLSRALGASRTLSEPLSAAADAVSRLGIFGRSLTDILSAAVDAVTRRAVLLRAPADVLSAAVDGLLRAAARLLTEGVGPATSSLQRGVGRASSESVGPALDSLFRAAGRSVLEALTAATDAVVKGAGAHLVSVADSLTAATDALSRQWLGNRSPAEVLTAASDSLQRLASRPLNESLPVAVDSLQRSVSRGLADTLGAASDTLQRNAGRLLSTALIAATDAVSALKGGVQAFSRTVSESLTPATDVVSRIWVGRRAASESVGPTLDSLQREAGRLLSTVLTAATDALSRRYLSFRSLSETLSTSDALSRTWSGLRSTAESVGPATSSLLRNAGRNLVSTLSPTSDSLIRSAFGFRVTVAESLSAALDSVLAEQIRGLVQDISVVLGQPFSAWSLRLSQSRWLLGSPLGRWLFKSGKSSWETESDEERWDARPPEV